MTTDRKETPMIATATCPVCGTQDCPMTRQPMTRFSLSQTDYYRLRDETNWPKDCPRGWVAIQAAPSVARGNGISRSVEMWTADAADLADYLWDAAGASAAAAADDGGARGGWQRRLLTRLTKAMGADDPALTR